MIAKKSKVLYELLATVSEELTEMTIGIPTK